MTGLAPRAPVAEQAPLYHPARGPARPWPEDEASRQGVQGDECRRVSGMPLSSCFPQNPMNNPGSGTLKSGGYFVSVPRNLGDPDASLALPDRGTGTDHPLAPGGASAAEGNERRT